MSTYAEFRAAEAHTMTRLMRHLGELETAELFLKTTEAAIQKNVDQEMGGRKMMGSRPDDIYRTRYSSDVDWRVALDNVHYHERRAGVLAAAATAIQGHMQGMTGGHPMGILQP